MELLASNNYSFSQKHHFLNDWEARVIGKAIQIPVPCLCLSCPKHFLTFGVQGHIPQDLGGRRGMDSTHSPQPCLPILPQLGQGLGVKARGGGRKATQNASSLLSWELIHLRLHVSEKNHMAEPSCRSCSWRCLSHILPPHPWCHRQGRHRQVWT